MSNNIMFEKCLVLDAHMLAKDVVELHEELEEEDALIAGNFLDELEGPALKALKEGEPKRHIELKNLWWYGECSGSTFEEVFIEQIVPHIMGHVEVIYTHENGHLQGLAIKDGEVIRCKVEQRLVKPEGW